MSTPDDIFTPDFRAAPYWWDATPRPDPGPSDLPPKTDVLIIGSGYTGLCAAIEVARAGRQPVVIDAQDLGWGCSSRNGGLVSTSIKPGFAELARRHGEKAAFNILGEGHSALAWIKEFVAAEKLDCHFTIGGKFMGAHTRGHYEKLAASLASQTEGLEVPAHMVPKAEQHREIGTDAYFGGAVYEQHASIDPAAYHQCLLRLARDAGVYFVANCRATDVERKSGSLQVTTSKGTVTAKNVVVATNGYTDGLSPWLKRRVIRIGSYMVATEPLNADVMARLMPHNRTFGDTRKVVYYYRPSPDRRRIIFGGRVTGAETDPLKSAPLLRRDLIALFPELADVRLSHSWMGFVAYTFDHLAHIGQHDGIHYAMGYCGSGVSMASYLGTRIGQQVLGKKEGFTAFDNVRFQTRPLYNGEPWFLTATVAYYRWRDRMGF